MKAVIRQLRDYVATARDIARHDGVVILLWRVITKLLSPVLDLDCQILFEIDLSQPVEQRHARVECRIEPGTEADVDELLEMRIPSWRLGDAEELSDADEYRLLLVERERARARAGARVYMRQWFRAGEKCFVARVDGEIAHSKADKDIETCEEGFTASAEIEAFGEKCSSACKEGREARQEDCRS